MQDFKKFLHKLSAIGIATAIPCDEAIAFNGNQGIFIFDINIGTELGNVNLNHEAFGVPDRFQIEYDGVIVADSLYVGDSLTGNPPNYSGMVGSTYNNVPEYFWDGVQFVANGNTQNITIMQSDVAPFGSTAGAGTINFQKISSLPSVMTVRVFAPLGGTAWNLDTECPDLVGIGCSENLNFSSDDQAGRYFTNVELGLGTGLVTLDYNAANIPDRFQIMYDGVMVADSRYVGGYFSGNPPDADTALWEGGGGSGMFVGKSYNGIPDYEWDGVTFVASGPTNNYTVLQSEVADFGDTAGAGTLSFIKTNPLPSVMTIITTSLPANTGFDFTPACPIAEPTNIQLTTTSTASSWVANTVTNGGSTLRWDSTNGFVYGKTGDSPDFDLSANIGDADMYIYDTTNVTDFNVENLDISSIDVSGNINLQTLNVGDNDLSTLDVSQNTALAILNCYINNLTTLDVTNNTALTALSCFDNSITALDVDSNTLLEQLYCSNNSLNTLSVTLNTALLELECGNNSISTLDVTNNTLLTSLVCDANSISTLDVSANTNLVTLDCSSNSLTNLVITANTLLTTLRCDGNVLVAGDIDNILIQLDTNGLSNGVLDIPLGRTAASDAALTSLQGKGWTVTEI